MNARIRDREGNSAIRRPGPAPAACLPLVVWLSATALSATAALGQCGTWNPLVNLSNATDRYAVDSSMAIDADGKVHIIYQRFLDSEGHNYYVTNASGSWSTPYLLGTMGGKGSAPIILITPDNQLHVFYGKNTLYWRSRPVGGGSWSSPQQISVNPNDGFISGAAVDASGGIYFVYGHLFDSGMPVRNGIYGRYKPLGGAWQATELIYGNNQDSNWPNCTDLAARGTTLWIAINVDNAMFYKTAPAGGVWPAGRGTPFNEPGGGLRFAMNGPSGEIAALWARALSCPDPCEDHPWFEIYVKYSQDGGATWSGLFNLSAMVNDIDRSPRAAYDANGNLHVLWEGFCCDHKLRMRYRGRIGGVWGPIQIMSPLVGGHSFQSIATFGANVHATFSNTGTGVGRYDVVYTSMNVTQPGITASPASFSRTTWVGQAPPDDTLLVTNACVGTLNYTLGVDAPWLQVLPAAGSSSGETDPITVRYAGVPGLRAGAYSATITVAGNAVNSPVTVPVQLTVRTVKPDLDGDGDVDQADVGLFQECLTGAFVPQNELPCLPARLDADDDVDQDDLNIMLNCLQNSGPDIPAPQNCAG